MHAVLREPVSPSLDTNGDLVGDTMCVAMMGLLVGRPAHEPHRPLQHGPGPRVLTCDALFAEVQLAPHRIYHWPDMCSPRRLAGGALALASAPAN